MQRSLVSSPLAVIARTIKMSTKTARKTAWSTLAFALLVMVTQLAVACGGGTDKPPLTPDDPTLTAMDAGDTPPPDPNAVAPAAPAAK